MSYTSDDPLSNSVPTLNDFSEGTLLRDESTEGESRVTSRKRKAFAFDNENEEQIKKIIRKISEMLGKTKQQKSDSKTLGDLKRFVLVCEEFQTKILDSPANHLQGQTQASAPRVNQVPTATAVANELAIDSFDVDELDFCDFDVDALSESELLGGKVMDSKGFRGKKDEATDEITMKRAEREKGELKAENEKLKRRLKQLERDNRETNEKLTQIEKKLTQIEREMSPTSLQRIAQELAKNGTEGDFKEGEVGYKFPNGTLFRSMYVLESRYSSVRELVAN